MATKHIHIHVGDANPDEAKLRSIRQKLTDASRDPEALKNVASSPLIKKTAEDAERLVDQARQMLFNVQ